MSRVDDYGRRLLEALDEEVGGRMYTRYDIEIAQMGYREGYKEAVKDAKEWLKMHLAEWSQVDDADLAGFMKTLEDKI